MAKQIEVTVGKDGQIKLRTTGYSGNECRKATEPLEKALGLKTSDIATAEALVSTSATVKQ